jgi:hypothetical protein
MTLFIRSNILLSLIDGDILCDMYLPDTIINRKLLVSLDGVKSTNKTIYVYNRTYHSEHIEHKIMDEPNINSCILKFSGSADEEYINFLSVALSLDNFDVLNINGLSIKSEKYSPGIEILLKCGL